MAAGFPPKYTENYPLNNYASEQFIALASETANTLGWQVQSASEYSIVAYTNKGIFANNSIIKIIISEDEAQITSETVGSAVFDMGKNKKNVSDFILTLKGRTVAYPNENLLEKYEALKSSFVPAEKDTLNPSNASANKFSFVSIFKPREGYYITPILIDINILVFILMVISGVNFFLPDTQDLIKWGANFRPITLEGQWWRLLTNCFLHIGIIHLLMNMYALLYIGLLLEPYLGKAEFLAAYLLTGIVASVTSIYWHELTVSAGASGAIFGMYGVFLALLTSNVIAKEVRKPLMISISIFVVYNLANGLKGGIDNAAHIGGLISGIIIGYISLLSIKKDNVSGFRSAALILSVLFVLLTSFILVKKIPNYYAQYDKNMQSFSNNETAALNILKNADNVSKEDLIRLLQDSGIYYWNENVSLLRQTGKLDLPKTLSVKNGLLLQYSLHRIKSFELISKYVQDTTNAAIQDSLQSYNGLIFADMKLLKGDNSGDAQ